MSVVDLVLGSIVLALAGWALVQTGSRKPAGGGCCSGSGRLSPDGDEAEPGREPLVMLRRGGDAGSER